MRLRLVTDDEPFHPTLEQAIDDFLADCDLRGLSPKTIEWYRYALGPFARFVGGGDVEAGHVTERDVRRFLAAQKERVAPR
jgi:site-specific recombinase XerD